MAKIRVVIADDHPTFRQGLSRLLADDSELEIVGQAADGEEAVNLSRKLNPNVVILDLAMPKLNGIEATKQIKESSPNTTVLVVSAYNYQSYVLASLRAGATGYLTKDTPIVELKTAVRVANDGVGLIIHGINQSIVRRLVSTDSGLKGSGELFPREIEVLKLTAQGMRNKHIARALSISERTVQAHLSNIFNKLNVNSRTEAVLRAVQEGWLEIYDLSN